MDTSLSECFLPPSPGGQDTILGPQHVWGVGLTRPPDPGVVVFLLARQPSLAPGRSPHTASFLIQEHTSLESKDHVVRINKTGIPELEFFRLL